MRPYIMMMQKRLDTSTTGTNEANVDGILRDGFLDAKTTPGCCGLGGTYLKSVSQVACRYGRKYLNLRRRKITTCIFICEIPDCDVRNVRVARGCRTKYRIRQHSVERFKGMCSIGLQRFNDLDEDEFKTKVMQLYMHKGEIKRRSWRFDKYLVSQDYIKPEYLLYVYKYEKNN